MNNMIYIFLILITVLIIIINNKFNTMAKTFEEFNEKLDSQESHLANIIADLERLKEQISAMGLTSEQEELLFARLSGITDQLENTADSTEDPIVVTPEEPNLEEEV